MSQDTTSRSDFFTDAAQAEHLANELLLGRCIWCPELGWLTWTGQCWAEVHDAQVVELVRQHIRTKYSNAAARGVTKVAEAWRRRLSASKLTATLSLSRGIPNVLVYGADLDADRYLLNTATGTLDLRTGEVVPHDRLDRLTKVTPTGLGDTGAELWRTFLERIQPDPELRTFLQRLMGAALLGEVRDHVMPIFNGDGANGKGAFRSAVIHALGPYAIEVDPAILIEGKHSRHLTFLMELRGRRVVFCSETSRGAKFAESEMKRLVGGDPIQANRMRHDPITFLPSHTLIMVTNHLPNISGDDEANWRRVLVIPFDVVIPEHERDPELPERLRLAAPAILSWLHEGWLEYCRIGLAPPEAVRLRTKQYREDNDAITQFFEERCMLSPAATVPPRILFQAWTQWAARNGHVAGSEKGFTMALDKRGIQKRGRVWAGVRLYADTDETDDYGQAAA